VQPTLHLGRLPRVSLHSCGQTLGEGWGRGIECGLVGIGHWPARRWTLRLRIADDSGVGIGWGGPERRTCFLSLDSKHVRAGNEVRFHTSNSRPLLALSHLKFTFIRGTQRRVGVKVVLGWN